MPANLTPEYRKAEQQFRDAQSPAEKLSALELMLATIPKHKGTDKMQGDLKRRIARMRAEQMATKKGKGGFDPYHVERSGAGQVVLIGTPNCGKSMIVQSLTNAAVVVGPYPFATAMPVPGMAKYEDVQIQLVDMPPYTEHGFPPGMVGAIRNADVIAVVIDAAAKDVLSQLDLAMKLLKGRKIVPPGTVEPDDETNDDEEVHIVWEKEILVVATKMDASDQNDRVIETLTELYPTLEFIGVSGDSGENLDVMVRRLFEMLHCVRVYSKPPGKKPDMSQPFVLKVGSTIMDLAGAIHRDLPDHLKFARVWGEGHYPGQQVPHDYVLKDKDVLEVHA